MIGNGVIHNERKTKHNEIAIKRQIKQKERISKNKYDK